MKNSPCQTYSTQYLTIVGNLRMMFEGMTAIIGRIDVDGEVALIADGSANRRGVRIRDDEWKTARLNPSVAIGYSGQVDYGNQVLARLLGRRDLQAQRADVRLVRVLEGNNIQRPDLAWATARENVSRLLLQLRSEIEARRPYDTSIEPLELTIVMVGVSPSKPLLCFWHKNHNWRPEDLGPVEPGRIGATIGVGPGGESLDIHGILEDLERPLEERAKLAIQEYARAFPERVNDYTTIRRGSNGFALEIYS